MAVIYDVVEKVNPIAPTEPKKYHVSLKSIAQLSNRQVAKVLSEGLTVTPSEAEAVINRLETVIPALLKGGYTVKFGDWASIWITVKSRGKETPEEVRPDNVTKVNVHCRFSKSFQDSLQKLDYVPATRWYPKEEVVEEDEEEEMVLELDPKSKAKKG